MKRQYGVQVVWKDPKKAGADPDEEPRWYAFDTQEQADSFARSYVSTVGEKLSYRTPYDGPDKDEPWMDHDVAEVNRAERWAVEDYSDWEPR